MTMLSFAFTLLAALIFVFGALLGFFRGWKKSVVDIGVAVISLILSAIIAAPILGMVEERIEPLIRNIVIQRLGEASYEQLMEASPTVDMLISKLPVALLAPVAFTLIFSLLAFVASFFVPLIASAIFGSDKKRNTKDEDDEALENKESDEIPEPEEDEKPPMSWLKRHLLGIPGGVACAAIVAFAILLPFAGYIGSITDVFDELKASESADIQEVLESDTFQSIDEILDPLGNDVAIKVTYNLGGKALFNALTSININDERYHVSQALSITINAFVDTEFLTSVSFDDYGEAQIYALNDMRLDIDEDPLVKHLIAEIVSGAAKSWEDGGTFVSVKKPDVGDGNFGSVIHEILSIYSTMTYDTVSSDLKVITDLFSVLIENHAMSVLEHNDDLMDLFNQEWFATDFLHTLQENERMRPVVEEISKLAIALMAEQVGIPQGDTEEYKELLTDVASSINTAKASEDSNKAIAELEADILQLFADNDLEVPSEVVDYVSENMLQTFDGKENVTVDDLVDYLTKTFNEFDQYGKIIA